ncbi:hypothetical protein [Corynebacterium cystitidis]|uniref:Uncharacterized protein n=1 Tax=Corynebacterium cystitidis DSM 20524 TaxID=1121357 RepID=A0A1H9U5C0_9CORY|nr:hypothetical protein [Corynebacterium cystitidis]WJY81170.1 hypothetical protein CCYS_00930 [Corynebacterium cystitidis DSM 20524]SES04364.1 hypothetical protein SAMN05661109_01656 [Corynebacterium cystitidis DSM 20524]SNV89670.1 Uncharacterised protein [Corynebacterium cystitidis]
MPRMTQPRLEPLSSLGFFGEKSDSDVSNVINLAARRVSRNQTESRFHTLLVRAETVAAGEHVIRHIGIDESTQLDQVRDGLGIVFGMSFGPAPARFTLGRDDAGRLNGALTLGSLLLRTGDHLHFHYGLHHFTLILGDRWPRDEDTPRLLCVGGVGELPGSSFDLAEINASLVDERVVDSVLAATRPDVRDVIERAKIFDFIPLLQAIDLDRHVDLSSPVESALESLPREAAPIEVDAFWSTVLGLSCLAADELTDTVIEETMEALGWTTATGSGMSAADTKRLCTSSLETLSSIGAYGDDVVAPADRLDVFRELLRNSSVTD